jgi:hydroxymethylglutaryl-CoA lyase
MLALPDRVEVVEVAPRDGLQSFPRPVDTATKIRMIDALSAAAFPVIEVTSFAHPRAVPNLADAEAVLGGIARRPGTVYRALVPNARGAARAVAAGAGEVLGLATISRSYLRRNQNMTREEAAEQAIRAFGVARSAGLRFVMALGMSFWCPYEGLIPEDDVLAFVDQLYEAGIRRFYLAGSVGLEDPRHVGRLFRRLTGLHPDCSFGYHVHDRAGFAPANILAALDAGARWIEGAICGMGGGIAIPGTVGSVGNYPTEDLVNLLETAGISSGLALDDVLLAARRVADILEIAPASRAAHGGTRAAVLNAPLGTCVGVLTG